MALDEITSVGSDTMPEGMVIVGEKFICSKHGDVTHGCIITPYIVQEDGKAVKYNRRFCVQCIAEMYDAAAEAGKIGKIIQQNMVATPEDAEKIKAERDRKVKEILEKAKAEAEAAEASSEEEKEDGNKAE